jgi:hypothetical protein
MFFYLFLCDYMKYESTQKIIIIVYEKVTIFHYIR